MKFTEIKESLHFLLVLGNFVEEEEEGLEDEDVIPISINKNI